MTGAEEDRGMARKVGKTPMRGIRVPDEQWQRWLDAVEADEEETSVSEVIRFLMDKYADKQLGRKR